MHLKVSHLSNRSTGYYVEALDPLTVDNLDTRRLICALQGFNA